MSSDKINITCSTDKNFIQHCAVLLQSIVSNNPEIEFRFFILTESNENITDKFLSFLNELKQEYHFVIIDHDLVKKFPMHSQHLSRAAYYRIFLSKLISDDIKKIIYFDCDIIVAGKIKELWEIDVSNYFLGAVYNPTWWKISESHMINNLGITDGRYFNSGVLLINLEKWREADIPSKLVEFLNKHGHKNVTHDQDTLNAVVAHCWLKIHPKFNFMNAFYNGYDKNKKFAYYKQYSDKELKVAIKNPVVIHYTYRKPWRYMSKHPLKSEYWKYLKMTPWKDWKPDDKTLFNKLLKFFLPEKFVLKIGWELRKRLPHEIKIKLKKYLLVR